MSKQYTDHQAKIKKRLVFRTIAIIAIVLVVFLASCNNNTDLPVSNPDQHQHSDQTPVQPIGLPTEPAIDQTIRVKFTNSTDDIWPPQPLDVTNVINLQTQPQTSEKDNAERAILLDRKITAHLTGRHATLASHTIKDKSNNLVKVETEFFLYDSNKVLTASYLADRKTAQPISYTLTYATDYQPPESQLEVKRAIALASNALEKQGFSHHKVLIGTAILAYPTAAEVAENGKHFFQSRKLYVTFGPGKGAAPHYRALVNLSNLTVEYSGSMQ